MSASRLLSRSSVAGLDLLDYDPCGVWPDSRGACAYRAVEQLVHVNPWMPPLSVCAEHLAGHLAEHCLAGRASTERSEGTMTRGAKRAGGGIYKGMEQCPYCGTHVSELVPGDHRLCEQQRADAYAEGILEGLRRHTWMKDGVTYVGNGTYTLQQAIELAQQDRVVA